MIDIVKWLSYFWVFGIGVTVGYALHWGKNRLAPGDRLHCLKCGILVAIVPKNVLDRVKRVGAK